MSGAPVPSPQVPWEELSRVYSVQPGGPGNAIHGHLPQYVVTPENPDQLAAVLKWANANHAAAGVRGGGSKLEWGNPPRRLDLVISTAALHHVIEHAHQDMTATVEAGCTVADFQRALAQHGQRLALDPLFPERATIGGVLATNDSGPLRTRFGSMRDLIIGITVALSDGTLARSGGKVVKNVAGYDLQKLFTGSLGTLGVIAQATFRLHPLPAAAGTVSFPFSVVQDANQFMLAVLDSNMAPSAIQLRTGRERSTHVDVLFEGITAGIDAQMQQIRSLAAVEPQAAIEPWRAREELWMRPGVACIGKWTALPSNIGAGCAHIHSVATELELDWVAVVQAIGIGLVRLEGDAQRLATAIGRLRQQFESAGGSLVVLHQPAELHDSVESWGSAGSALPLMLNVKQQFDPAGILNGGRFVGGI